MKKNEVSKVDYTGAQIWKVSTDKTDVQNILSRLQRRNLISSWQGDKTSFHVLVRANAIQHVTDVFKREKIKFEVIIEDVQRMINEENTPLKEYKLVLQEKGHGLTWKKYHRLEDIYSFMDNLAKTYPTLVRVLSIGKSFEDRHLKVLRLSDGKPTNKAVFIEGGVHAREWISPATVTYFIDQFVKNFDMESDDVKNIDWYFMPVVNPDGYEYTHMVDRLWRKNRRPGTPSSACFGTDLNRNFGFRWGGKGSSTDPCNETYHGIRAFSEPETKALSNFIKHRAAYFTAYLSYHSYGQYLLYPWGYDNAVPPDYEQLNSVGNSMAQAIQQAGGNKYLVGASSGLLYFAAGASDDWAKALGIKFSYTIELSDRGQFGFVLPTSFIEPVAKGNLAGLRMLATHINKM